MKFTLLLLLGLSSISIFAQSQSPEPCIFDQSSQTDAFLQGIEALEHYTWDKEKRLATILLENSDTLLIYRGGCMHFGVGAEFRLADDGNLSLEPVFKQVLWVTQLLPQQFDHDRLQQAIDQKDYQVESLGSSTKFITFIDGLLRDNHYEVVIETEGARKTVSISQFLN